MINQKLIHGFHVFSLGQNTLDIVAYSDKMLFLDLGPGTSDLGSLI